MISTFHFVYIFSGIERILLCRLVAIIVNISFSSNTAVASMLRLCPSRRINVTRTDQRPSPILCALVNVADCGIPISLHNDSLQPFSISESEGSSGQQPNSKTAKQAKANNFCTLQLLFLFKPRDHLKVQRISSSTSLYAGHRHDH